MISKVYKLPNGKKAVFEYDITGVGKTTLECMDDLMAMVADRPQGEWIDYEIPRENGGAMPIQACSLCKTFYPLAYTGGGHRFCPNCGAHMKGADDGEMA